MAKETFDIETAEELSNAALNLNRSSLSAVEFNDLSQTLSASAINLFLVVGLEEDASGGVEPLIQTPEDIGISDGVLTNPAEDFPLPLSDAFSALPVELTTFDAVTSDNSATLIWQTASETNNAGFEVQRAEGETDETDENASWSTLAFMETAGTTDQPQSYHFTTENMPVGTHHFGLRQIDTDVPSPSPSPWRWM